MKYSLVAASVVLTLSFSSSGYASDAVINIDGDNSTGIATQSTTESSNAIIAITASNSDAKISQSGSDGAIGKITQNGDNSSAEITQTQDDTVKKIQKNRQAIISQTASDGFNKALINQTTAAGIAKIIQRDSTTNADARIITKGNALATIEQASVIGVIGVRTAEIDNTGNSNATINQTRGNQITASIVQKGNGNTSTIQQGYVNGIQLTSSTASILIDGEDNELSIEQKFGANNTARATVTKGDENIINLKQHGGENLASIVTFGNGNTSGDAEYMVLQDGNFNIATATITGSDNTIAISQLGDNHMATTTINGAGNTSLISQQ
jgi:hypothetical protein